VDALREMLARNPYAAFRLKPGTKRVVTFLREKPRVRLDLPVAVARARILSMDGKHVFSAYDPSPRGPVFMRLIEKTFGRDVTTRTWDTVTKVARYAGAHHFRARRSSAKSGVISRSVIACTVSTIAAFAGVGTPSCCRSATTYPVMKSIRSP
jgi:hypothetical protein